MQPFVFGSGYDAVAGQRMGYDQLAVQMAEKDRQARADAFNQAQQAQIFAQRQSEEDNRQRRAQDYQFSQAAQANQDRQQEMARRAFEFGVTSKQHDTSESRIAQSEADRLQMQKDTNAANLKMGNEDADYKEAVNRIDRGMISHPSDIDTLFPHMNSDQKARAASYWKEQNDKAHEDYQSITGYAKAANSIVKDLRTKSGKNGTPMTEDEAYALLASQRSTAKWLPNLRFDEGSQEWTPSMPKPFTQPATTTGTNGSAEPTGFQIPFTPGSARLPFPGSVSPDAPVPADAPAAPSPAPAPPSSFWAGAKAVGGMALNRFAFPGVSPVVDAQSVIPQFPSFPVGRTAPDFQQSPPIDQGAASWMMNRARTPQAPAPAPVTPTVGTSTNGFAFPTQPINPALPPTATMPIPVPAAMPPTNAAPPAPMPPTNAPFVPRTMPFGNRGTMVTDFSQRPDAPAAPAPVADVAPVVDRDGMVRVKSPDGRTGRIPAAKFLAAKAAGWVAVSDVPIQ